MTLARGRLVPLLKRSVLVQEIELAALLGLIHHFVYLVAALFEDALDRLVLVPCHRWIVQFHRWIIQFKTPDRPFVVLIGLEPRSFVVRLLSHEVTEVAKVFIVFLRVHHICFPGIHVSIVGTCH